MEIIRVYSEDPADWEAVADFLIDFISQLTSEG